MWRQFPGGPKSNEVVDIDNLEDPTGRDRDEVAGRIPKAVWFNEMNPVPAGSNDASTRCKDISHPLTIAIGQREEVLILCPEDIDGRLI
jgi:hypothetical protein